VRGQCHAASEARSLAIAGTRATGMRVNYADHASEGGVGNDTVHHKQLQAYCACLCLLLHSSPALGYPNATPSQHWYVCARLTTVFIPAPPSCRAAWRCMVLRGAAHA